MALAPGCSMPSHDHSEFSSSRCKILRLARVQNGNDLTARSLHNGFRSSKRLGENSICNTVFKITSEWRTLVPVSGLDPSLA